MKKFTVLFAVLVVLAMTLAACAPTNENGTPVGTPDLMTTPGDITEPGDLATPTMDDMVMETPTVEVEATPTEAAPMETATPEVIETEEPLETPVLPDTGFRDPSRASYLIGADVWNMQGEQLGEITDLVVNLSNSQVEYAILSRGGLLGIGADLYPIPWGALTISTNRTTDVVPGAGTPTPDAATPAAPGTLPDVTMFDDVIVTVDIDEEALDNAPTLDRDAFRDFDGTSMDWDVEWRNYWDTQGVMTTLPETGMTTGMQGLVLAEDLMGMDVENQAGEEIAEIEDIVVNLDSGEVQYVLLDAGLFLETNNRLVPVPLQALNFVRDDDGDYDVVVNVDEETLRTAPSYEVDLFPNTRTPDWDTELRNFWNTITFSR